ncbi:MAG: fructose-bisphosphate aldolase class I [Verrucomicrobia bacterium]|nr:fructose-bisphosphate aldolase class I [Verrucomicrobiota bacterium]
MNSLEETARALVAPGKGILAADESTPTITKRFKSINVESTEEYRRDYRAALFSAQGLEESISGVILFDETLRQKNREGVPMLQLLQEQGIIPGIKVDKSTKPLAFFPDEKITEGLDDLRDRLNEYRELGAKFTKWRAVITIGANIPTEFCIKANAHALARYAALSQEAGLVPIVEPEVLMNGDHSIERCYSVTELTLKLVFEELFQHRVVLEQMLLKASMVISGKDAPAQSSASAVAERTIACLKHTVPAAVPGIVFLSGGQSDVRATENLNEMNRIDGVPWQLSFSYGRALQSPALNAWGGSPANVGSAQKALLHRAKCNSAARFGKYSSGME